MRRLWIADERGSLPLALLAVIIVAGIVTVLVATVITGQRQTRFDQNFEQAVQVADDGLDRMVSLIEQQILETEPGDVVQRSDEVNGGSWIAQVEHLALKQWRITSTGTAADGTQRTAVMSVEVDSIFNVAAFGKFFAEFAGGNFVDSYRSGTHDEDDGTWSDLNGDSRICLPNGSQAEPGSTGQAANVVMCNQTGNGTVATNGRLFLRGQDFDNTDRVEIHYTRDEPFVEDPLPGATGYCHGVNQVCQAWVDTNDGKLQYFREELKLPMDPVIIPGNPSGAFDPASYWDPNCTEDQATSDYTSCLGPGRHVFTDMTLTQDTKIEGTPNDPTMVYLVGMLQVPRGEFVNFEQQTDGTWEPKPPPGFLVFSSGTGPAIDLRNHSSISGGVYAPNGSATGGAGVNVYGSIVSGTISTQGGWRFHYDDALGDVLVEAPVVATNWTEIFDHVTPLDE